MARKSSDNFTKAEKATIRERDGGLCQLSRLLGPEFCSSLVETDAEAEYHHIVPASKGGERSIENAALLHKKCHTAHYEALHGWEAVGARYQFSAAARAHYIYRRGKKGKRGD